MTSPVNLTAEEMTKLGHSLDSVQYPPEMGGVSLSFYLVTAFYMCRLILFRDTSHTSKAYIKSTVCRHCGKTITIINTLSCSPGMEKCYVNYQKLPSGISSTV